MGDSYDRIRKECHTRGEPDISDATIADWTSYCCEVCMDSLDCRYGNQPLIDGQGHIVKVDECKIGRPKCHVGRLVEGMWVLGLIDRQNREIRLKVCPDKRRDAQTLLRLIRKHIQPNTEIYIDCRRGYDSLNQHQFQHMSRLSRGGVHHKDMAMHPENGRDAQTLLRFTRKHVQPNTTIYTDCWRGYDSVNQHQFQHISVNHSLNFVNPVTGVHTNNIESVWRPLRKRLSRGGIHHNDMAMHPDNGRDAQTQPKITTRALTLSTLHGSEDVTVCIEETNDVKENVVFKLGCLHVIRPLPRIQPAASSRRGFASVVTSSPYKASLLESQAKIRGNEKSGDGVVNGKGNSAARRLFIGKGKKATKTDQEETSEEESDPKYSDSSDSEDNDAVFIL
ncbi:hypothetical protein ANN_26034 [Periplaneta americana]|uniref:ISXO2-like transposase domain-containing protein n=1 Tax=Periplaneta americana TaxID=6978 RepID=A0ABQ8S511_PERAM|nr:hypothetical protein ANN_26034 [Periplaneta americana]